MYLARNIFTLIKFCFTGAYCMEHECLDELIKYGARVTQTSEDIAGDKKLFTPFHLLCYNLIRRRVKRYEF